jgi:AraC-like DNA-binding protein
MLKKSQSPAPVRAQNPVARASEILAQAIEQFVQERHSKRLLQDLQLAQDIFKVNGLTDHANLAESLTPAALNYRGDVAAATITSIRIFGDLRFRARHRLYAGQTAYTLLYAGIASPTSMAFVRSYEALATTSATMDDGALSAFAVVARARLYRALAQAGIPSGFHVDSTSPPTLSRIGLHHVVSGIHAELLERLKTSGLPRPMDPRVLLTSDLLHALLEPSSVGVDGFVNRRTDAPRASPTSRALLEGQALAWTGRHEVAIRFLNKALDGATEGALRPLQSAAHFELAQAYLHTGQPERSNAHMMAYCRLREQKLTALFSTLADQHDRLSTEQSESVASPMLGPGRLQSVPPYLRRACAFVEQSYAQALTADDIVNAAEVARRTLENAFRQYLGTTLMEHLKSVRLRVAGDMLRNTDLVLGDIRAAVGYRHASTFSTDYARRFGMPPSAVRRAENLPWIRSKGGAEAIE